MGNQWIGAFCLALAVSSCGGSSSPESQHQEPTLERFATLSASSIAVDSGGSVYALASQPLASSRALFRIRQEASPQNLNEPGADAANVIATDAVANLYFSQFHGCGMAGCVSAVFKFGSNGTTTLVTNVSADAEGLVFDSQGGLYVSDFHGNGIWKVSNGQTTLLAGPQGDPNVLPGHQVFPCLEVDGQGTDARFCGPKGLAIDAAGNLFVADVGGHTIRRITPQGTVTTIAGVAFSAGSMDGPSTSATFNQPGQVAVDAQGNVYVADTGNALIRKISAGGAVTTVAGTRGLSGFTPGPLPGVLDAPSSIVRSGTDLYFAMPTAIGRITNVH